MNDFNYFMADSSSSTGFSKIPQGTVRWPSGGMRVESHYTPQEGDVYLKPPPPLTETDSPLVWARGKSTSQRFKDLGLRPLHWKEDDPPGKFPLGGGATWVVKAE